MKKVTILCFALLTILLFSIAPFTGSFSIKPAKAEGISIQWGHLESDFNTTEKILKET